MGGADVDVAGTFYSKHVGLSTKETIHNTRARSMQKSKHHPAMEVSTAVRAGRAIDPGVLALVAVAAFLVHPAQVEAVAWASAFPYVLSLTALLLALLAYLDRRLIVSIACYAASLLVRASAIGFPVALVLVDLYPLGRHRRTSL